MLSDDRGVGSTPFRLDQDFDRTGNSGFFGSGVMDAGPGTVFAKHGQAAGRQFALKGEKMSFVFFFKI